MQSNVTQSLFSRASFLRKAYIFHHPENHESGNENTNSIISLMLCFSAKVNSKYQGPKDKAPFHLLLIFENPNGFEM